jgi:hypothetical protein
MAYLEEDRDAGTENISFLPQAHAETIDYTERFPVVDGKPL